MRNYETFKTEAKRLTSITCDKYGTELYTTPHQPYWTLSYGLHYPRTKHDLCETCYNGIVGVIDEYIYPPVIEGCCYDGRGGWNWCGDETCAVMNGPTPQSPPDPSTPT